MALLLSKYCYRNESFSTSTQAQEKIPMEMGGDRDFGGGLSYRSISDPLCGK
jgi:hypothetical protein